MSQDERLLDFDPQDRQYFREILDKRRESYHQLLIHPEIHAKDFWDVVVITAIDEVQQRYYEHQIDQKKRRGEIPSSVKYHVVPDPPGVKVGCGGSTLVVLDLLEKEYGDALDRYRVMLIHAGGYSKRLANHTISGKIFCPVPFFLNEGSPSITMLEMKFILFIEFPKKMTGGIFLAASDDIELLESEGCDFTRPGVTALAHPARSSIGLTHGVFVLDKSEIPNLKRNNNSTVKCLKFLHKPTMETMQSEGALISNASYEVFVDSNFFFDRSVAKKLLQVDLFLFFN